MQGRAWNKIPGRPVSFKFYLLIDFYKKTGKPKRERERRTLALLAEQQALCCPCAAWPNPWPKAEGHSVLDLTLEIRVRPAGGGPFE